MNCPQCDIEVQEGRCPSCGWTEQTETEAHPEKGPTIRSSYIEMPHGITKQEFGVDLYDAITTIGGILCVDTQMHAAEGKGEWHKMHEFTQRRHALCATLKNLMVALSSQEVMEVLDRYPTIQSM